MIIRQLLAKDVHASVSILLQQFEPEEPLTVTFALNHPTLQLQLQQRHQLWTHWLEVSNQKGLAMGAFDPISDQLAAICICKDVNYELPEIEEEYTASLTEEKCFIALEEHFLEGMDKQLRENMSIEGTALEIMIIAVKKVYQGKGLSKVLINEAQKLAKEKSFRYCYCQASNFKTAKSLQKNNFTKLIEIDLREFQVLNVKPFFNISQQHSLASSWLKTIHSS